MIRLSNEMREQFEQLCKNELIDMSVKARQLINKELKSRIK